MVAEAVATQPRDGLVARLVGAGVPVAPVLDREGMLAAAPVPQVPDPAPARPKPPGPCRPSTSIVARASGSPAEGGRTSRRVLLRSTGRMPRITDLLRANEAYAAARANVADPRPGRHLAIVTCMDARIDVFAVLGLHLGEAHVIRNAGGRVTEDVLRSLALSSGVLGVDTAVVMQHTKCGLVGVSDAQLREMTGADLGFLPIDDHAAALREDVDLLARTPYLSRLQPDRRPGLRRRERPARRRGALGATRLRPRSGPPNPRPRGIRPAPALRSCGRPRAGCTVSATFRPDSTPVRPEPRQGGRPGASAHPRSRPKEPPCRPMTPQPSRP